jgi:type IV secretion system protein TrbD
MNGDTRVKIHRSLTRPHLVMGGDRELVLTYIIVCAILIGAVMTWTAFFTGFVMLALGFPIFQRMAKIDPDLRKVYLRHIRYHLSYEARSKPSRKN